MNCAEPSRVELGDVSARAAPARRRARRPRRAARGPRRPARAAGLEVPDDVGGREVGRGHVAETSEVPAKRLEGAERGADPEE